jgi:CRP/FNR family transcriptional regulator
VIGYSSLNSCQFCLRELDKFFIEPRSPLDFSKENHPHSIVLKRNDVLFSEGKFPKGIYRIHSGLVKVYKHGDDGKEQIIQICKPGDVVGFRSVLSERPYNLNAAALEENTIVCFISKDDFNHYKETNPRLQNRLILELSSELQESADFITNMTQKSVKQRTALALLFLHETYEGKPINISREDLANMVGTATETLIRLIKQFKKDDLIQVKGRKIEIMDIEALKHESSS